VDDQYGCRALVLLDGVDAGVELARRFGKLSIDNSDEAWSFLNYFTDGTSLRPSAETTLRQLSETDDAIKAFWSNEQAWALREQRDTPRTKEQGMQEVHERTRRELPLEKILDDAQARVGQYPSRYMRFGRYATEDELKAVLLRLRNESNEEVCVRLMWVFRRASLPDLDPRAWQLAESKNDDVRDAAVTALAQCTDPRVGDFGRATLRSALSTTAAAEGLEALVKIFSPMVKRSSWPCCHISPRAMKRLTTWGSAFRTFAARTRLPIFPICSAGITRTIRARFAGVIQ
jgi:hypothetical protein